MTSGDTKVERSQFREEGLVEGERGLWSGGGREAGAPPAPAIGVEGELGDDQQLGADLEGRVLEAPLGVTEDAEPRDLLRKPGRLGGRVLLSDSKQDDEAGTNRARLFKPA